MYIHRRRSMKKVFGLFIAVMICAGITACGKDPEVSADYFDDVKGTYTNYVDASEIMKVSSTEYETMVLFHTDKNVEDFRVFSLELNFDENGDVDFINKLLSVSQTKTHYLFR
jgi:hypothetical protein